MEKPAIQQVAGFSTLYINSRHALAFIHKSRLLQIQNEGCYLSLANRLTGRGVIAVPWTEIVK